MERFRMRALALLLLAATGAACADGVGGPADEAIVIGLAGPLDRGYGQSMQRAAEMVAEAINADGGIEGRPLELVVRDDAADPEQAIGVANQFVANPNLVAVVGHLTSGATLAAATVYNDGGNAVLQISPTASSPLVTNAGEWTFRVCPSDLAHGPAMARWLTDELGGAEAEVLYANDAYGRGVVASFSSAYQELGGGLVGSDPFLPSYASEEYRLDPYIERAMARGADGLVIAGLADEAIEIIRAARRLGYTGPVIGADGLLGVEEAGELAEGVYISTPFLPDRPDPRTQEFAAAYSERYGQAPDAYAALTHDALLLVVRAIEEVGADRIAVRDYIASVGRDRPAFEGVSGRIAFDENGDVEGKSVVIGVVRDGEVVTATGGRNTDRPQVAAPDPTTQSPEPDA